MVDQLPLFSFSCNSYVAPPVAEFHETLKAPSTSGLGAARLAGTAGSDTSTVVAVCHALQLVNVLTVLQPRTRYVYVPTARLLYPCDSDVPEYTWL